MAEGLTKEKIFVFGASGHSKVVIDIIERHGLYEIAFLVDDDPALRGMTFFGYPVIGGKRELLSAAGRVRAGIVAIGNNRARCSVAAWIAAAGFDLVPAVHPSAQIGRGVTIGGGTVVMAGVVINPGSSVGRNVIINSRASVDHDCTIGDGVHLAPGSTLCGSVTIGAEAFICAGGTIIPNLEVGEQSVVGAGSTVISSVGSYELVAGSPARYIKSLEVM